MITKHSNSFNDNQDQRIWEQANGANWYHCS